MKGRRRREIPRQKLGEAMKYSLRKQFERDIRKVRAKFLSGRPGHTLCMDVMNLIYMLQSVCPTKRSFERDAWCFKAYHELGDQVRRVLGFARPGAGAPKRVIPVYGSEEEAQLYEFLRRLGAE